MADVFISYAHEDDEYVERLRAALEDRGREVWSDRDIEPADRWKISANEAIDRSDAVLFVVSVASMASEACRGELAYATDVKKRLIAVCVDEAAADVADKPAEVAELSWIMMRPDDDFDAGVDRVIRALDVDLEVARTHTRILVRARAWELAERRASPLLRGEELTAAEDWLSRAALAGSPQPTELHREFIVASRRAATRRQRQVAGIASAVALVAIALSIFALIQRSQAIANQNTAQSRLLANDAETNLTADASLSTLLALRALKARDTAQAEEALRDALTHLQTLLVLRRATATVNSAAFSPDGSKIVTAGADGTARIWDARTGAQLGVLQAPPAPAATGSASSATPRAVTSAAFSPDGSKIVTASQDGAARIWNARTSAQLTILQGHNIVNKAGFSRDGSQIVAASNDGKARIWDAHSGSLLTSVREPSGSPVYDAAFSPDGSQIVTASQDGTARIWNPRTGTQLTTLNEPGGGAIDSAAFSADGSKLVTASQDGTARIWNARTGAQLATLKADTTTVESAAFSPDGSKIVTASLDGTVRVWDVRTGALLAAVSQDIGGLVSPSAAFSPDGTRIVATDGATAQILNARTGAQLTLPSDGVVFSAAFSPGGTRLVTANGFGVARVWDARTGAQLVSLRGPPGAMYSAAFSYDGTKIVTASNNGTARIWDAQRGSLLTSVGQPGGSPVYDAAFSPDGSQIVTASQDGTARIWDARTATQLRTLNEPGGQLLNSAAFSADGSKIVTASTDGTARIWAARRGVQLTVIRESTGYAASSAAFSPDASRVVTANRDIAANGGSAAIWNAHTGAQLAIFNMPSGISPTSAAFSPNGSQIVTTSNDGTTRIWDARSEAQLTQFKPPRGAVVTSAAFSPTGAELVTASADGAARVWSTALAGSIQSLERLARSLVTRPLTALERRTYLAGLAG